ncbi:hypothetical protein EON63_09240 [archaeon]|nr:MAG: hypothetical protein EON63_09240 [archaeon]
MSHTSTSIPIPIIQKPSIPTHTRSIHCNTTSIPTLASIPILILQSKYPYLHLYPSIPIPITHTLNTV